MTANRFATAAFYPRFNQADLAVVYPDSNSWKFASMHFDRGLNQWTNEVIDLDRYIAGQGIELAAADVDADGVEEVQVGLVHFGVHRSLDLGYLDSNSLPSGSGTEQVWQDRRISASDSIGGAQKPAVVLAPGDFDADGFTLEHTGLTDVRLGSPIPLVLMSAPPTKSGISQNYDDTESSYSQATSNGNSIGVTTHSSITYGVEAGFDLFGILGVSGRASLDKATERTQTTSKHETTVEGYRGAFDTDVIIFQGTLYETYEYRITAASDPAAIGTLVTLDFPVQANTYKWTVEYYNEQVEEEDRIGVDLLTHTAGDITTYPTQFELQQELVDQVHWDYAGSNGSGRPIGQGGSSDFQSISFATEMATDVQRSVTKSYGGGASIGIGGTIDKTNSESTTHSMVYGTETTFEANLGDISGFDDYQNWRYNWGFSVQTVGRTADTDNNPTGYTSRKHHFQYLRFWVDRNGSAY